MKKTFIKYFGVASTTLLAVAPVAAPVVQNALNATLTNKVFAADNTGTRVPMDLSGQDEYSQLLQRAIIGADAPFTSVNGQLVPYEDAPTYLAIQGNKVPWEDPTNPMNSGTVSQVDASIVDGLIKLAQYTNGVGNSDITSAKVFLNNAKQPLNAHSTDVAKYLFTNTDGSKRDYVYNFYYYKDNPTAFSGVRLNQNTSEYKAAKFISDKLGGHKVADVLGSSVFGNPNTATLKILINGSNGHDLTPKDVLRQGRIVITLTAQQAGFDETKKTAQAFLDLSNSNVLLIKSNASGAVQNDTSGSIYDPVPNHLSNNRAKDVFDQYANTANLGQFGSAFVNVADSGVSMDSTVADEAFLASAPYDAKTDSGADSATVAANLKAVGTVDKAGSLSAYATDAIVVPEGTSLETIVNKLNAVRYNGVPSINNYGSLGVKPQYIAYDDVVANVNDWKTQIKAANGNSFSNVTEGSAATSLDKIDSGASDNAIVARPGSFSVPVPVKGNVYIPSTVLGPAPATPIYKFDNGGKLYLKNYQATTNVNVIVYPNPSFWAKQYTLGTLPSFALFAPTTTNAVVPTFYDNGQTVKAADLPNSLQSKTLNITVGDSRFYDANSKTTSQNKLSSYLRGAFGNAVANKQILISDEDVKSSRQPIDTNKLKPDVDFPDGANYYTQRPDNNTNNAGDGSSFSIDVSAVDLSKAGTYDVKVTYTNAKNGKFGLGKEQSTITIPLTVTESDNPAFYFVGGVDQTITVGENFNRMNFKVARSLDEINQMVANGSANDGKDYVNDPDKTGIDVSISGDVDTNTPGNYTLVYTATNVATGKSTSLTRRINVINNTNPGGGSNTDQDKTEITDFKAIGYVDYVPGYGINVWDAPKGQATGQKLPDNSAWKISHKAVLADGQVWYQVGKNQWVDGQYISLSPVSRMKPLSGAIQINYVPGYGVRVYQSADTSKPTNKLLKHGTAWKVFGELNGFYNVGKNQWIKVDYGKRV